MIDPQVLAEKLRNDFPGATISIEDMTGGQDHYRVSIVWSGFAGLSAVARHRRVHESLREELRGPIHAITLDLQDGCAELNSKAD